MDVVERPANPRIAELVLPGLRPIGAHDRRRALRATAGAPLDVGELAGLALGLVLAAWLVIAVAALVQVRRGLRAQPGGVDEAERDDR